MSAIVYDTYEQFLEARIKTAFLYGLSDAFDIEDFEVTLERPKNGEERKSRDVAIPCMKLAPVIRKSPKLIAETLKPYVEEYSTGLERVEVFGGYINIFYDRAEFLAALAEPEPTDRLERLIRGLK